ncbi:MAG: RagB/SusD family nutrient uptake outer membrane protein [Bacteroidales bacterium]
MKTIKYILYICLLSLVASCGNGWLDLEPSTSVGDDEAPSLEKAKFTLNGIYNLMQSSDAYSGRMIYLGDVLGDDVQASGSTKRTARYYLMDYNKDNIASSFWRNPYEMIRNANLILSYIDNIEIAADETEDQKDFKGQALALRALATFDLTRIYGYTYTKDMGESLGVPVVKDVPQIDFKPRRNSVKECYSSIIDDLKQAVELLKNSSRDNSNKGKINKWSAITLLSRVYLYCGMNAEALAMAEEGINGAKAKGFRLWTNAEYEGGWSMEFQPEVLFEIVNITTDSPGKESMGYLCSNEGYSDMILTTPFIALIQKDKDDVRNKAIKKVVDSKKKTVTYFINKYQPEGGENVADANIPMFRMSELYLNAAEAAVKTGNNEKAALYLDAIVQRANPANTVKGSTISLDQVLTERRKEFFGEGHRSYDLLRNNMRVVRKDVTGTDATTKHLPLDNDVIDYDRTFFRSILPIPKYEMDANPNMRDQQNPGY